MTQDPIYLDHNATTPLLPEVVEAMVPWLRDHFGNPSSGHVYGQRTKEALERARAQIAALIGAAPDEIVMTSGGTEASNLAIRGVTEARLAKRRIVTTVIEHPATSAPCAWLEGRGWGITRAGVDSAGVVLVDEIEAALSPRTALVTVMHSNNETGVIQPIERIARAARAAGAVVHTDAAQSLGKVPVNVDALGVDLMSIAGHKLYAPKGVGALYIRTGTLVEPFARGAGHERGLRPGTENVASIVGLGEACAIVGADLDAVAARLEALRERLWERLCGQVDGLVINGGGAPRLPNTLNVRFPGVIGTALLAAAPEVAASTGSACHDGQEAASAVIVAMGVSPQEALGSVRLTLGRGTTEEAVDLAADALARAWGATRGA